MARQRGRLRAPQVSAGRQPAGWLKFRFTLSSRDVEEMLAQRGMEARCETVRCWTLTFGRTFAARLGNSNHVPRPVDSRNEPYGEPEPAAGNTLQNLRDDLGLFDARDDLERPAAANAALALDAEPQRVDHPSRFARFFLESSGCASGGARAASHHQIAWRERCTAHSQRHRPCVRGDRGSVREGPASNALTHCSD